MTNIQEEFAALSKKREDLANRTMRINVTVEEARRRQSALQAQAKEKYGVSTIEELREKLAAMKRENAAAVTAFKEALALAEKKVVEAETIISNASAPTSGARA
jgi:hypothetical protein